MTITTNPDVTWSDHGSITLVTPHTEAAREWIDEFIQEDPQWYGRSLVVEPRYLDDLLEGMRGDGLVVE